MSMDYSDHEHIEEKTRSVPQGTEPPQTPTSHTEQSTQSDQKPDQAAQDAHQQIQDIAIQIGEDPARLKKHRDVSTVLERMKEGLTASVHISRPRFWSKLTLDDLGLSVGNTLAVSEAANTVLNTYFRLGRRSLLPKEYQDKLNLVETSARQCIAKHSFKSHWGSFVPLTLYPAWKEANAEVEAEFWRVRDEIVEHYEEIIDQVVEESRPLAEDAWRRVTLGTALNTQHDALSREVVEEIVAQLQAAEGKEHFVSNYLAAIRAAMPKQWDIKDGFSYEVERGVIPLPSLLARDMEHADRIYQERALQDAKTRAELEAIEAQRRAEMHRLTLQQQQEREELSRRLYAEQERQRLQLEMEQDVLRDARRQKERLVQEFYTGIVQQINALIAETTEQIQTSLEKHEGILHGRASVQLTNLIKRLEKFNFVRDKQIEDQLQRLRDVLPKPDEKERAAKGLARIDTTRITQVVRAIHEEAQHALIDLETQPQRRGKRDQPLSQEPVNLEARRTARAGATLTEMEHPDSQEQDDTNGGIQPPNRRQKRTL